MTESVRAPTADPDVSLSVRNERPADMATPYKRFVELGEGTHTVMMEKNRMRFFRAVAAFRKETDPTALT